MPRPSILRSHHENPEHAQALLALLPENQSRSASAPSLSRSSDSGDEEELIEEEVDEMEGDEEDWV